MTIRRFLGRSIAALCVTGAVSLTAVGSAPSAANAEDQLLAPDEGTALLAESVPQLAQAGAKPDLPLRKAARTKPPEIEAIEKAGAPEDVKRRVPASRKARLDRCNQIPQCKANLDAAKKALGRRSMLSPERGTSLAFVLNPFRIAEAQAQAAGTVMLTPCRNKDSAGTNFDGYMNIWGGYQSGCHADLVRNFGPTLSRVFTGPLGTDGAPYALIRVRVPATGYYLINVDANTYIANIETNLRHFEPGCYCLVVPSLTDPNIGRQDHPWVLYLEQGTHYFKFHPTASSSWGRVRVNVVTIEPI